MASRDFVAVALVWLSNQAIGYGMLGYPWTWDSCGLGYCDWRLPPDWLLWLHPVIRPPVRRPSSTSLPFVAAFTTFELALYAAGLRTPGQRWGLRHRRS